MENDKKCEAITLRFIIGGVPVEIDIPLPDAWQNFAPFQLLRELVKAMDEARRFADDDQAD